MTASRSLLVLADPRVRWRVRRVLGVGGMARVLLAEQWRDGRFERLVAIKRMHEHLVENDDLVRMFFDESRIASAVVHPNVVRVLDVPVREGERFIVMEYVEGVSLARIMQRFHSRGQRVPLAVALRVLGDTLRGLHAAHEARDAAGKSLEIVHRDVAPQNVLVSALGVARITDFGVARAVGRLTVTAPGSTKGHLAYSAPEILGGGEVTPRADVFAAGVILWEMLSGCRLMAADSPTETLHKVATANIGPPLDAAPPLAAVCARALDRDPARRYPTARAFALALDEATTSLGLSSVRTEVRALVHEMCNDEGPGDSSDRIPLAEPDASSELRPHPSGRHPRGTASRTSDSDRAPRDVNETERRAGTEERRTSDVPVETLARAPVSSIVRRSLRTTSRAECALAASLVTLAVAALALSGSWVWTSLHPAPTLPSDRVITPAESGQEVQTLPDGASLDTEGTASAIPSVPASAHGASRKGTVRRASHRATALPPNPY